MTNLISKFFAKGLLNDEERHAIRIYSPRSTLFKDTDGTYYGSIKIWQNREITITVLNLSDWEFLANCIKSVLYWESDGSAEIAGYSITSAKIDGKRCIFNGDILGECRPWKEVPVLEIENIGNGGFRRKPLISNKKTYVVYDGKNYEEKAMVQVGDILEFVDN